ncbi:MAG: diguanylate cyclase [Candidatus Stahlbacteria bacterium]|nr:MAG: diguanylate cyclase [Candidatus Stahlbacteria bacterium]
MSLKIKLPLMVSLLVLLSVAGVSYFLIRYEQKVLGEELTRRGELLAKQLAGVDRVAFNLIARDAEYLRFGDSTFSFERSSSSFEKERVLSAALTEAVASSGVLQAVFFDWDGFPVLYLDTGTAAELEDEIEEDVGSEGGGSLFKHPDSILSVLGEPADGFTFTSPLLIGSDTLGFAQVRIDPSVLDRAIRDALIKVLPVLGGILGVSVLLSLLFSMFFTVPVSRLKKHALELAKGDLSVRVKVRSRDELGLLGRVFNKMAHNLQRTYGEIQEKLVEIRRLFKMATEDGLTGLYVKRYFLELLAGELRRSIRYERPLSLLMCDIDHFKRINDTYGHPAGDVVLRSIARQLSVATREGIDIIGRYGGEEFAVMLPETDEETAWVIAERVRKAVGSEPISLKGMGGVGENQITVTISVGVTTARETTSLDRLIATADRALYLAKENGRNRSTALALER